MNFDAGNAESPYVETAELGVRTVQPTGKITSDLFFTAHVFGNQAAANQALAEGNPELAEAFLKKEAKIRKDALESEFSGYSERVDKSFEAKITTPALTWQEFNLAIELLEKLGRKNESANFHYLVFVRPKSNIKYATRMVEMERSANYALSEKNYPGAAKYFQVAGELAREAKKYGQMSGSNADHFLERMLEQELLCLSGILENSMSIGNPGPLLTQKQTNRLMEVLELFGLQSEEGHFNSLVRESKRLYDERRTAPSDLEYIYDAKCKITDALLKGDCSQAASLSKYLHEANRMAMDAFSQKDYLRAAFLFKMAGELLMIAKKYGQLPLKDADYSFECARHLEFSCYAEIVEKSSEDSSTPLLSLLQARRAIQLLDESGNTSKILPFLQSVISSYAIGSERKGKENAGIAEPEREIEYRNQEQPILSKVA